MLFRSGQEFSDEEIIDDLPVYEGLTPLQTMQVYAQVIEEFENETTTASLLAYNAGV